MAVLAIELHQLKTLFPEESSEGNERVNALWKRTHALSMDIQRLSHRLHSSKLDHLGIVAALSGLSGEFSGQNEIEIDFQYRQVPPLDSETSLSIFRVVQESLHNVSKHSQAQKVLVELIGSEGAVVLRVSDDGVGFDRDSPDNQNGLGMVSMDDPKDVMNLTVQYSKLPDGTNHIDSLVVDGVSKQLNVAIKNSNYAHV